MLAGAPVIAARSGGIPEIIDSGRNGILTENRDPAVLAAAVKELLADPARRAALASAARRTAVEKFGLEIMVRSVQNHILETAKRGSQ
jgi:glycosyltransferase involved in cell wall biosynthesis